MSKHEVTEPTGDALQAAAFAQRIYTKRLRSAEDLGNWKRSQAYFDLVAYINNTSMIIQGYRQGSGYIITKQIIKLCKIFNWLDRLVYMCHPLGVGQGLLRCVGEDKLEKMESSHSLHQKCHRAYREWLLTVQEKIFSILEQQVQPQCKHINELAQYLYRSFGSHKTYHYGPGNEVMFIFFLCGLFKSGILQSEDTMAAALLLYQRYLDLVRRIIKFYRLSSTHNHSNNVVDDYNVLPYIWGCAQLCRNAPFSPPQWEEPAIMDNHRKDYMLLSSLAHLQKTMNNVPLGVHSYQLWCILSLSNWPDAYSGLMQTFVKNVLNNFYTVKDLIFTEIMSFRRQPSEVLQCAYLGALPKEEKQMSSSSKHENVELTKDDKGKMMDPPVDRHISLETDVFLGFQRPQKSSNDSDDFVGNPLCRPRGHHTSLNRQASTLTYPRLTPNPSEEQLDSLGSSCINNKSNEIPLSDMEDKSSQSN